MGVDALSRIRAARRFDLVVGADGLHSIVRRLAFGADAEFVRHAGLYAATLPLPGNADAGREMFMLNTPGKLAALHPCREFHSHISFSGIRRSPSSTTPISTSTNAFWRGRLPALAGEYRSFSIAVRAANDMYFDLVARVDVANWARGRIALLGDASSCVSLFGDGSTLAMAGAYELATALTESPTDPRGAFRRYQAVHGKLVASKQKNLARVASRIVPKTETGIWLNTRVFWRTLGAVGTAMRMGRKLRRR